MLDSIDHVIIAVEDLDEASKNYEMILGNPPVWKGEHKEFGTKNTLFNFQNTYLELLAVGGEGIGADLIKHTLEVNGEGLSGIVFKTPDMNRFRNQEKGYYLADVSRTRHKFRNERKKAWGINCLNFQEEFSFIIEHTQGNESKEYESSENLTMLLSIPMMQMDLLRFTVIVFGIRLALDKF